MNEIKIKDKQNDLMKKYPDNLTFKDVLKALKNKVIDIINKYQYT